VIDEKYRDFTRDLGVELVEKTKDPGLFDDTPFNRGYRAALYAVLHSMQLKAQTFGVSDDNIGLSGFSADEWRTKGRDYWKS